MMLSNTKIFYKYLPLAISIAIVGCVATEKSKYLDEEPIAFVGHGVFFDNSGKQISPTVDFVAEAQQWYRKALTKQLSDPKKTEFQNIDKELKNGLELTGQSALVVEQRSLDWLVGNIAKDKLDMRMVGKIRLLEYRLAWRLPTAENKATDQAVLFKLDPELQRRLQTPKFKFREIFAAQPTVNSGQAYLDECAAAGVPIPPPIGQLDPTGINGWKSEGFIPTAEQFIVGSPAEVRSFENANGMCIALPRYSDTSLNTVQLDGVICLSQTTSKVCIWDNQMNQTGFSFSTNDTIPIGVPDLTIDPAGRFQAGGLELESGSGGVCTDCHAGENPYIIHPDSVLRSGFTMESLGVDLPMFGPDRYDPIVAASWPQNALSHSMTTVPAECKSCHQQGGAGRLPHLSADLPGFCNVVLQQAVDKTMPTYNPGGLAGTQEVTDFQDWCGVPATSGPSNRGDPHLTTTNGINYDFQSAGEFVALHNPDSGFELQTRQTPVSTTFIPGVNTYTGLASCVSINTAAAMRLGKNRVSYQPIVKGEKRPELTDTMEMRLNGKLISLPAGGLDLGGGDRIDQGVDGGFVVTSSDGTRVAVTPTNWTSQGYWYLNFEVTDTPAREGTMGHIRKSDWLPLAPDGKSFGSAPTALDDRYVLLNHKFANAWRVSQARSLFDYAPGQSTKSFTDWDWPTKPGDQCQVTSAVPAIPGPNGPPLKRMEPALAERFCEKIEDKNARNECVFDLTVMGDRTLVKAFESSLRARQKK